MPYTKTDWVDDVTPLSAENMNNLETQYDLGKADLDTKMNQTTGHKHTGAAGDAPKIGTSGLDFDPATQAELDAKMHQTTGHKHTGAVGDGPVLDLLKLAEVNVTAGDTGQVTIDGVSLNAWEGLVLVSEVIQTYNGTTHFKLRFNNDGIDGNYFYQIMQANSGTVSADSGSLPIIFRGNSNSNGRILAITDISISPSGYAMAITRAFVQNASYIQSCGMIKSSGTVADITRLDIIAANTAIGVNSCFRLYKRRV